MSQRKVGTKVSSKISDTHHVSSQVDTEDSDGSQRQGDISNDKEEEGRNLRDVAGDIWHSGTRRIDHGHEANEAQLLGRKVDLISVKCKALWELIIRQIEMAKT
uniref:Uncharacterized protein n=1 Tax=Hippocampus comes TaxID=109280 RepID=A0A3Q3DRA8_HIPCM